MIKIVDLGTYQVFAPEQQELLIKVMDLGTYQIFGPKQEGDEGWQR